MFLSYALVHLHPPTCFGFGTGTCLLALEVFLGPISIPLTDLSRFAVIQGLYDVRIYLHINPKSPIS